MKILSLIDWPVVLACVVPAVLLISLVIFSNKNRDGEVDRKYPIKLAFITAGFVVSQIAVFWLSAIAIAFLAYTAVFAAIGGAGSGLQELVLPVKIGVGIFVVLWSVGSMYFLKFITELEFRNEYLTFILVFLLVAGECIFGYDLHASKKTVHRYGYVDRSGKFTIKPTYGEAWMFHGGIARVTADTEYTKKSFRNEMFGGKHKEKTGATYYINHIGEVVTPSKLKLAEYEQFLAEYQRSFRRVQLEKTGNVEHSSFSEGMAIARIPGQRDYGFVDENMNIIITPIYWSVRPFSEGRAAVNNNGGYATWGYVDNQGQLVVIPQYREALDYSEGLAVVARNVEPDKYKQEILKYGAIDKSGKVVIPFEFEDMRPFAEGLAPAKVDVTEQE